MKILTQIYDHHRADSLATALRNKRFSFFYTLLSTLPNPIKILDVGGRAAFWESTGLLDSKTFVVEITLINTSELEVGGANLHPRLGHFVGDAREMNQFQAKEFDVVFSNSVIEHVGSYADQGRMAREIERVGKRYFVQTPNFYFPIEPHFVFPAFHWMPIVLRTWLVTHFSLGWYEKFDCSNRAKEEVESIRLLTESKLVRLFPDAQLHRENFFGMTKSFIVYHGWNNIK
jgi:2-polyprenyl-3-methyl-5-hydroxy-6-metoxy-1,4-benzoquinol methylase